jgi:eukaryotic-like serine/threonine-protein kinase
VSNSPHETFPRSAQADDSAAAPQPVYARRYAVVRELARGGMGRVLIARDQRLGRDVALKVLRPGPHDSKQLRRFEQEARAAGSLNHPNILTVFDAGEHEGEPYIVTELLEGQTLREVLNDGPLAPARAADLALQLAEGLAVAHEHAIIHRDIKPENLFITRDGRLKILDFGVARLPRESGVASGPSTETGVVLGTVTYMSPEQVRGREVDARSDLFAFGSVFHEILSGSPPFERTTALETGHAIVGEPAPDLPKCVPRYLGQIVERCLSKDPLKRFRSARELAGTLAISSPVTPARVRRWTAVAVAIAACGLASVFLARAIPRLQRGETVALTSPSAPNERIIVAVADFANETRDADLDGLSGLLITSLEQSRRLRVITRSRMADLLRQLGKDPSLRIDESLAREVGRSAGARALLLATARQFDDMYTVELRAIEPSSDEYLFSLKEQASGKRSIPELIDRLAEQARGAFQESTTEVRSSGAGAARMAAGNLVAYRHYFDALRLEDQYDFDAAEAELRAALRADPGFAPAHLRLATLSPSRPAAERASHLRAALEHGERLPEADQLAVRAEEEILRGRFDESATLLERVVELRPDDKRILMRLAQVRARDSFEAAKPIAERALALDPSFHPAWDLIAVSFAWTGNSQGCEAWAQEHARKWPSPTTFSILNGCRLWAGDYSGAIEAARKAVELGGGSESEDALEIRLRTLFVTEEFAVAEFEARRLWDRGMRLLPMWTLPEVLRYRGKRKEAYRLLEQMERTTSRLDSRLLRVQHGAGDRDPQLRDLVRQAVPDLHVPRLALALVVAGDPAEAGRLLSEHPVDQVGLWGVHGRPVANEVVAAVRTRARGDGVRARQMLEGARSRVLFRDVRVLDYFIGETCHMIADDPCTVDALADGRRFIWHGSDSVLPGSIAYPRSLYMLAHSYERLRRPAEARPVVEKLVTLWKDADPDLPLLAEARALCKKLGCRAP